LASCPSGYFIAGDVSTPGQMQCTPCPPGSDCVDPPCVNECKPCKQGYYKSTTIAYPTQLPRTAFDDVSGSYVRNWIEEPCRACPVNTFRNLEGGTEIGTCAPCPAKSTTMGLTGRTTFADCKCDVFFYQQASSMSSDLLCADCPQGAVCNSNRACSLNQLTKDTFVVGDIQEILLCDSPVDRLVGRWYRNITGEYRLIACPSGYTLQRSDLSVTSDRCVMCPAGTYLLDEVLDPAIKCLPCPIGAYCPGGNAVMSLPGFWRLPEVANGQRRLLPGANMSIATIYPCPLGVCGGNNTCKNNRTGPVSDLIRLLKIQSD
jgi:hypothetical protein